LAGCVYCIDNDVLKKLVTFDLFDETVKLFGASNEQVNVLETAKYKFQGDWEKVKKGKSRKPEDQLVNYERTVELAETLPQIAITEVDITLFEQLTSFEGIDQGEAILTIYVTQILQKDKSSQALILTHDKNFLRTLAKVELPVVQTVFPHRFWCLEQLILRDIEAYGFEVIRDKIVPVRDCDQAIKAVFGSGALSTSENSLTTLNSYIETLRKETGNLLHPYPNQP
jgi:hypothetical protein